MEKNKLCECGCGRETNIYRGNYNNFIHGHSNKGKKHIKESNEKNRLAHLGKKHSKETKSKIREAGLGKKNPMFGKKHSEETKRKMSKLRMGEKNHNYGKKFSKGTRRKMKEARAKQVLPVKDTSIEVKIQNQLKEIGYEFFTHQRMKIDHSYQCDILIPALNLVVEIDGDYWHKYPVGNDIDHIRTKELIEKGFKVLRLWECEIRKMDTGELQIRILNEVNKND